MWDGYLNECNEEENLAMQIRRSQSRYRCRSRRSEGRERSHIRIGFACTQLDGRMNANIYLYTMLGHTYLNLFLNRLVAIQIIADLRWISMIGHARSIQIERLLHHRGQHIGEHIEKHCRFNGDFLVPLFIAAIVVVRDSTVLIVPPCIIVAHLLLCRSMCLCVRTHSRRRIIVLQLAENGIVDER